ncbi:peptidase C78, ubiquitin fold modifier-specific peptidase 1/ 2 isoform X1 [Wolffia australiana]
MNCCEGVSEMSVRLLCGRRLNAVISSGEPELYWLVGSTLVLPRTVVSIIKCLHWTPSLGPESVDFSREADDFRTFLLRGLDVVGALIVSNQDHEENAMNAVKATIGIRERFVPDKGTCSVIGASANASTKDVRFFLSPMGKLESLDLIPSVIPEDFPEKFLWERVCLIRCSLTLKLPVYASINKKSDSEEVFSSTVDAVAAKFRDPTTLYLIESKKLKSEETIPPVVLHGSELGFDACVPDFGFPGSAATVGNKPLLTCSQFFKNMKPPSSLMENVDTIHVSVFSNLSDSSLACVAPLGRYFPAPEPVKCSVVDFKLDVLCFSSRDFPLDSTISRLVIPALVSQLLEMKQSTTPKLCMNHPQLHPYHFYPPGVLHPITAIYDKTYGEMEAEQVEIRRSLHLRFGLPVDRPLLLTSNSLPFTCMPTSSESRKSGTTLLKDVHIDISSRGVSGGLVSLIQGSYEYYHYLQNGFDDNGWGCAYRSLQTIVSWFRLQNYTSIEVPSHREIQQALVEIGDKELSFVGSHEWIGAIELSFVLDKLLGVSCRIMNVRSGAELPEKCRELAMHFETQGTPVMIGGGVLAYTLLGVDYNDVTGDCAFLILDPHYTGIDEVKRVVNGGWCGWKKAVDSRGKSFFLSDKFYNLLLPQRPNIV